VSRFEELSRKVDAFFARVAVRHGTDMQCATGCSDCCHVRLTITAVEAAAIRAHVAGWPAGQRRDLAGGSIGEGRVRGMATPTDLPAGPGASPVGSTDRCAALDAAGRCKIYEARPLVCRSHGVPIRMRRGALPVVQACHRNFVHTTPDPDCVLDQATLSATLLAVDAAAAARPGTTEPSAASPAATEPAAAAPDTEPGPAGAPGQRIDLAGLLADLATF
jgi:Fe-S-cluster containining protein